MKTKEQERRVDEWTADYITALNDNFYNDQVQSYGLMVQNSANCYSDHAVKMLKRIKERNPKDLYTWRSIKGRKYNKIVQREWSSEDRKFVDRTVHAFVDRYTGEVYKPAGWQNVAKHVRYDMRIIKERETLHNPDKIDWAGGHLYMR